ncbi:MAG: DUF2785 domain-containing protein [Anaerolineae bacterium]|nr:DUF2785 domain-containing protein [Anaerolineae bacterium]
MEKAFWQGIIANEFAVPGGHTAFALTEAHLLGYLGSTDPELRDEFGYGIFVKWLIAGHYTPEQLQTLRVRMLANLTAGLGEQDTETVFLRAFSILLLAAIAYYDNHTQQFFSADEVHDLLARTLAYFAGEQDLRGYVPGKGWAHSCAHTADLIDELMLNRYLGAAELTRLLDAVADKLLAPTGYTYRHDEDERLSYAVLTGLKRELLNREAVGAWLKRFTGALEAQPRHTRVDDPDAYSAYLNAKNFLRSLYVRLNATDDLPDNVRALIPDVLAAVQAYGF